MGTNGGDHYGAYCVDKTGIPDVVPYTDGFLLRRRGDVQRLNAEGGSIIIIAAGQGAVALRRDDGRPDGAAEAASSHGGVEDPLLETTSDEPVATSDSRS